MVVLEEMGNVLWRGSSLHVLQEPQLALEASSPAEKITNFT